jgi:Uma2 family endonuclease
MLARPQLKQYYTEEEYFALEEKSEHKHEFYRGEIFAMVGGSVNHNRIARNVLTTLDNALRNTRCEAFGSDMRVLVETHGLYTYPAALVVCGDIDLVQARTDTITNPTLIVEVLSPSTQDYDRSQKFEFYRAISSLQDCVLIHQDKIHLEHHSKQTKGWLLTDLTSLDDVLSLSSVNLQIPLRRLYARVDWLTVDS